MENIEQSQYKYLIIYIIRVLKELPSFLILIRNLTKKNNPELKNHYKKKKGGVDFST